MLNLGLNITSQGAKSLPTTPAFSPLDLSPTVWLDARVGVTESLGRVSNWADQSGNGNNFAQLVAAEQPFYNTTAINGLPGVDFDNDMANLTISTLSPQIGGLAATYIFMFKRDVDENAAQHLMSKTGAANARRLFIDSLGSLVYEDGGNGQDSISDATIDDTNPHIVAFTQESNVNIRYRIDNNSMASGGTTFQGGILTSTYTIGASQAGTGSLGGPISQVFMWDSILSDADIAKVVNYCNEIYSIF